MDKTKEFKDPDTLNLTREQILNKFKKIENDVYKTKEGALNKVKFKMIFAIINFVVSKYDTKVLNNIFLRMVKEFDTMRYDNALSSDDPIFDKLKEIKKDD